MFFPFIVSSLLPYYLDKKNNYFKESLLQLKVYILQKLQVDQSTLVKAKRMYKA